MRIISGEEVVAVFGPCKEWWIVRVLYAEREVAIGVFLRMKGFVEIVQCFDSGELLR